MRFAWIAASLVFLLAGCGGGGSAPPPVVSSFTNSGPVASGTAATLNAVFSGGTGVVDHGLNAISSGVALPTGLVTSNTTYTLTVTNSSGKSVTASTTVTLLHSLTLAIAGLGSLPADVTVTGPNNYSQHLTGTQTLAGLPDGTYTLAAAVVTDVTQPGLGRGNGGTLGSAYLQRYPLKPVQTVSISGGEARATVEYPAATLTVQVPIKENPAVTASMDFVLVPAGSYTMGSNDPLDSESLNAQPPHTVTIGAAFYIGKTHLTQAQWKAVMGAGNNPSTLRGDAFPVDNVSLTMLQAPTTGFLDQLNVALGGYGLRLPSEAEYEYVCRADTTTAYFFGTDATDLSLYANYTFVSMIVAGSLRPNPWGLYDITGNVDHWLADDSHVGYTGAPTDGSAWVDSPRGPYTVLRGGSWGSYADQVKYYRSARRITTIPGGINNAGIGCRLVLPVPRP